MKLSRRARIRAATVIAIGSALGLTACSSSASSGADSGSSGSDFNVSVIVGGAPELPIFCYLSVQLPQNLGIYHQNGISVKLEGLTGATSALQLLATNKADFAVSTPSSFAQLAAQGNDPGAKMVFLQEPDPGWLLVVPPSSKITTLADLKGKSIGVESFGVSVYPAMQKMLPEVGVSDKDVHFVSTGAGGPAQLALQKGTVQALALTDFELAELQNTGLKTKTIPLTPQMQANPGLAIAASDSFIKAHPKQVGEFLRALVQGTIMMQDNPKTCIQMHWRVYPEGKTPGVSDAVALQQALHETNAQAVAFMPPAGGKYGSFPAADMQAVSKVYGNNVDISSMYTNQFINAANGFDESSWAAKVRGFTLTSKS